MNTQIFTDVDNYIAGLFAPEDEVLKNVIHSLDEAGIPQISVSATQGGLLQVLMRACNAYRVLELGTLGGYSTIWMARALPAGGKLITIEYEERHALVAARNIAGAGLLDRVEIRVGRALDVLQQLLTAGEPPFDFIFIDADKPPYPQYYELAIQLSRPGTIIVCDNVIREGDVLDPNNNDDRVYGVRQLNGMVSRDSRVSATIMQNVGVKTHDGMLMAVVK